ncbi:MAG: serine O-acetyltransferase [Sulfurovum sp.]|jgi:serine O-acetyltransferase
MFSLINLIGSDLHRYSGKKSFKLFIKTYLLSPGFQCIFWFRIVSKYNNNALKYFLFRKMFKYGIEIHPGAQIGRELYIGHWVGIVISPKAVIGENCYISHGVTIGMINSGNNAGVPVIGDRVYIGAGAKIIGNIKIGNDVAIGANAVVTKDIPSGVTVGGVPAKIISSNDSSGYIKWKIN